MPRIGIIPGYGEGEVATKYIIKLIKALKRRFRTKIEFEIIPLGDYVKYGSSLTDEAISQMRSCDAIFSGDMYSNSNPIEYSINDIAMALDNNIEFAHITGLKENESVDIHIASYFDGGFLLRQGERNLEGCTEIRVCSTFTAMNVVSCVSRLCEESRRRLVFVKDTDNEYCANLFYSKFKDFTLPLSNFRLFNYSTVDVCYEMLHDLKQFDYIFASKSFMENAMGICRFKMQDNFASFYKYANQKCVYTAKSLIDNTYSGNYVPTINSYIAALCELLNSEFKLKKEAFSLRRSMNNALDVLKETDDCEKYITKIIEELQNPVEGVFNTKKSSKSRYIINKERH